MAEVAGLVLGVVPIVLEALRQYERLYRLCKRFKKCKNGVEELLDCLQTQRVIFMNETRLLLASSVGSNDAEAMMHDDQHPLWHDLATEASVNSLLGDSRDALISSGQHINRKMKHFEEEIGRFRFDDSSGREWRKEARKRFKYVFSESKLLEIAASIAKLTKRYRTLRSQVQELTILKPEPAHDSQTTQAVERVLATQAAAKRVYEVLATACKLHTNHHAHFSLRPQYHTSKTVTEIKFQIAYRHLSRQQAQGSQDVLWFVVESVLTGTVSTIPRLLSPDPLAQRMKRPGSPTLVSIQGTIQTTQKRVKFRTPSPDPIPRCRSPTTVSPTAPVIPDLGTIHDFCTHLRACCRNAHSNGACIGWLENSPQWKHRVLQSRGPKERATQKGAETLTTLLSYTTRGSSAHQGLTILQRLQLAKLLATATLDFHSTPWMQSYWKSDDIFLYDVDTSMGRAVVKEPEAFVEVPVNQQTCKTPSQLPDALAPFVRNSTLFNLAVILLELAYEKPLYDMIDPSDAKFGMPATTINYYAALRLSKEVAAQLGPRYAQIVEQCLFCDFGQGTELSNPALQDAIQKNVVSELDRLADGFQKLLIA